MQEAVLNFVRVPMMGTYVTHKPTPRSGNRVGGGGPGDIYKCAPGGDNDYCYILCTSPEMFVSLCEVIGHPEIVSDERFTGRNRAKNVEALTALINEWTGRHTKFEVMRILGEAGVPCGAVLDSVELLNDPHLKQRGMIVTIKHPVRGDFTMPGCPVRLEDSPVEVTAAPLLGEHNADVYGELLGLGAGQLEDLKREGII
jgi:formyl-CoA transferase